MSAVDEVKQKIDIAELIGQYTTLKKAGRNLTALCPFHSEKTPSFFVYPDQQSWHCFGACSTGGDVFSFLMKKENLDFGEALRQLAQRAGVTLPTRPEQQARHDENERLYQANEAAMRYFHDLLLKSPSAEKARSYLAGRGVNQKATIDFQLGYAINSWDALKQHLSEKGFNEAEMLAAGLLAANEEKKTYDRFRNKLMFPISDARGRVIGFGARVLDDSLPKYVNSPQTPLFDKSGTIYGLNLAGQAIRKQDMAVIVEGYMDVIIAHQYGFQNVIAAMGTALTEKHIVILKKMTRNLSLAFDADSAGEEAMLRCVDYENTMDAEIKVMVLPGGKDPDEVIKEDPAVWQNLMEKAEPALDFTFDMVTAGLDMRTTANKTLATGKLLPVIAKLKDSLRQDHYLNRLAGLTGISYNRLEHALGQAKPAARTPAPKTSPTGELRTSPKPAALLSNPLEEDCLILLLQHPELKARDCTLVREHFENSAHREIFAAWQRFDDPTSLRENLDTSLLDYLDALLKVDKPILATRIEERYNAYVLRLQEEYLRSLERKRAAVFALEAEQKGSGADLDKLKEDGIGASTGLKDVFIQKAKNSTYHTQKRH